MEAPRVVVVMGVSGSGKSTIGALLARRNGGEFHDGDDFHPQENIDKMAAGHPLTDADRAPWLKKIRREVIDEVPAGGFAVVACSALKRRYRETLGTGRGDVALVHLAGRPGLLTDRLEHREGHYMKTNMLQSQLDALEAPAQDEGLTVNIDAPPEVIAERIEEALGLTPGRRATGA